MEKMLVQVAYMDSEDNCSFLTVYQGKRITGRICHKDFGVDIASNPKKGEPYRKLRIIDMEPSMFYPMPFHSYTIQFNGVKLPTFQAQYIGKYEIDDGPTDDFIYCDNDVVSIVSEWCVNNKEITQYLFDKHGFTPEEATIEHLKESICEKNYSRYFTDPKWAFLAEEIIRESTEIKSNDTV